MQDFIKKIHWLGHDAFRIEASKVIYFDPFELKGGPKADIIFISHDHYDHCSPEDVKKIQGTGTVIVTEKDSSKKLSGDIRVAKPGDDLTIDGVQVKCLPAYNLKKEFHPKAKGWLGFLVTIDGYKLYHTGDSDLIPEMENLMPDIALLPVSGTYVMDVDMAAQAALKIKPKLVIPMHYGSFIGSEMDAKRLKELLTGKVEVLILPRES